MMKEPPHKDLPLPRPAGNTPLITLVWMRGGAADAQAVMRRMIESSIGPYGTEAVTGGDRSLAWGLLMPDRPSSLTCWSVHSDPREVCLFEGEMYSDLPGIRLGPGENPDVAPAVAGAMRKDPWQQMPWLNGAYSCVYIDLLAGRVHAMGDQSGTRALYWYSDGRSLIITNNLWAFRGSDAIYRGIDPMTLSQMMTIGLPLAGRTWIEGVRQLQPGGRIRSSGDGETEARWVLPDADRASWPLSETVSVLRDSMDSTIGRISRRAGGTIGLGLSGGLDSRLCLSSLHAQGLPLLGLTFCHHPGDADNKVASSASALLGEPHDAVVLDSGLAYSLYRDMRIINEGESPGFGYFFLAAAAAGRCDALVIGSEAIRDTPMGPFWPWSIKRPGELADRILQAQATNFLPGEMRQVLAPSYRIYWADVMEEWRRSFEEMYRGSVMELYFDFLLVYRTQRRTRQRLDAARWFCLPVYPYMDNELYGVFRGIPLDHLRGERAHLALLSDYRNGLEGLVNSARHRMGIPIGREYDLRLLVHSARVIRQKLFEPLGRAWTKTLAACGRGTGLSHIVKGETDRIRDCGLFDRAAAERIFEGARCGAFLNRGALNSLVNAAVVHDLLFGPGLQEGLGFLETGRKIRFIPWETYGRTARYDAQCAAGEAGR